MGEDPSVPFWVLFISSLVSRSRMHFQWKGLKMLQPTSNEMLKSQCCKELWNHKSGRDLINPTWIIIEYQKVYILLSSSVESQTGNSSSLIHTTGLYWVLALCKLLNWIPEIQRQMRHVSLLLIHKWPKRHSASIIYFLNCLLCPPKFSK